MSPGLTRGIKKGLRTIAQVAAGGALTALVTALAGGLAPTTQAIVMGAWIAFVAFSQNWAEGAGKMPVLLPTPSLIPVAATIDAVLAPVAGTVEAVADEAGKVTGDVVDTAGGVVGAVTGQLLDDDERGGSGMIALLVIGFCILIIVGFFSVCDLAFNDEDEPGDNHLLGRVELISHDDGGCWDGECYDGDGRGGGQDYEQWNNQDRNRNRNRNRGAFSPGPFDDSPVDAFNGNTICLPGSTCYADDRQRDEQPPDEREMP